MRDKPQHTRGSTRMDATYSIGPRSIQKAEAGMQTGISTALLKQGLTAQG